MNKLANFWRGRLRNLAQGGILTFAIVLAVAKFSAWPDWQSIAADRGLVRLSFAHSGARSCRDRTPEELAALPRNMRTAQVCERARSAVRVELDIDGTMAFGADVSPGGIAGSGPSRVYRRFDLPAGTHRLVVRMRDDAAVEGFTHESAFDILLAAGKSIALDFDATVGKFFLH